MDPLGLHLPGAPAPGQLPWDRLLPLPSSKDKDGCGSLGPGRQGSLTWPGAKEERWPVARLATRWRQPQAPTASP